MYVQLTVCDAGPTLYQHWFNVSCLQENYVAVTSASTMSPSLYMYKKK